MQESVRKLAQTLLHNPEYITIKEKSVTIDKIKQSIYLSDDLQHKNQLLNHLLTEENIYKAIIFSATKVHTEKLAKQLREQGHEANALHGDIRQHKRNRILQQFRAGKINLLVATDVAARGIDVTDISHIINFDIPRTGEDYVHRIGRTGRAGREGTAISFVLMKEKSQLKRIETYINNKIDQCNVVGLEPKKASYSSQKPRKKPWHGHKQTGNRVNRDDNKHSWKFSQQKKKFYGHKKKFGRDKELAG